MSVLNQMLRDLESRGVEAEPAAESDLASAAPATPIVRPLAPAPERPVSQTVRIAAWSAVAVLIAATGASYAWYARHLEEFARAPQPLGSRQFAALAAPAAAPIAIAPIETSPGEATKPVPPPIGAAIEPITSPSEHKPATTPIAVAAPTAAREPVRNETRQAAPAAAELAPKLEARRDTRSSVSPSLPAPTATEPTAIATTSAAPTSTAPAATAAAATAPVAAAPAATATAQPIAENTAIVSHPANNGAALEVRAGELIARGRSVEAIAMLEQLLQQAPANGNARSTLAALQAEAGRRDLALQTLLAGSQLDPMRFAAAAARLQAELGGPLAALAILEQVPLGARDASHAALVGGLAQRAGEHGRAVDAFERALQAPNAPAIWWAGLAVSLEALEQPAAALAAFRRAAADPSLPAATRAFAAGRIKALLVHDTGQPSATDGALVRARP